MPELPSGEDEFCIFLHPVGAVTMRRSSKGSLLFTIPPEPVCCGWLDAFDEMPGRFLQISGRSHQRRKVFGI